MSGIARIGYFGGTFDPIHSGHVDVAREVLAAARLDWLRFLPAGRPPHKADGPFAEAWHRLAMLRLALVGEELMQVDGREMAVDGVHYTIETMQAVHHEQPDIDIHFIIGADMVAWLPKWKSIAELARLVSFIAVARPGTDLTAALDAAHREIPGLKLTHLVTKPNEVSSSEIRRRLAVGETIHGLVPAAVEAYIGDHDLYRQPPIL